MSIYIYDDDVDDDFYGSPNILTLIKVPNSNPVYLAGGYGADKLSLVFEGRAIILLLLSLFWLLEVDT